MQEIWKPIPNYEDYQVSNLGRVKSLKSNKDKILKQGNDNNNYLQVILYKDRKRKTFKVHKLVAIAFLNHKPDGMNLVINHINNKSLDNRLNNLEIITNRENCYTHYKGTSKYKGVCWSKNANKWIAQIQIGDKHKYLGSFQTEYDAHLTYQKELNKINRI